MFKLPPYPGWDGLHPIIIHFPVALLLLAPAFIVLGLFWQKQRAGLFTAALGTMLCGTIGTYVAFSTGMAAAQLVDHADGLDAVLTQHAAMAGRVRLAFTSLTCAWLAVLAILHFGRTRLSARMGVLLPVLLLLCYLPAMVMVVNVAHAGGRLVHSFGIHAMLPPEPLPAQSSGQSASHEKDH